MTDQPVTTGTENPPASTIRSGRFTLNLLTNLANYGLSILVGIWLTPYLITHLGLGVYGLIPLTSSTISYLSLLTFSISLMVGRGLMIATTHGDDEQATRLFNAAIAWNMLLLIIIVPACLVLLHPEWLFRIPAGYEGQARILFICVAASFFLNTLLSTFTISTFCRNRLDIRNAISILGTVCRAGTVIVIFRLTAPQLWHVGAATLLSTVLMLALAVWAWRVLMPTIHFSLRSIRWADIQGIMLSGGWYLVDQIGTLLLFSIDLLVVNRMLGPVAGGRYGSVAQWPMMLMSLNGVIATVFAPTIIALYAREDFLGLRRYVQRALRFVGLAIALPTGIICGFAAPLLRVWSGTSLLNEAPLLFILTIPLCINLWVAPLFDINVAVNKVRVPALVTCGLGVAKLLLAVLLAGPIGWGMYGVAIAGAIILTMKLYLFTPWYSARLLGWRWTTFYRGTVTIIIATLGIVGLCRLLSLWWPLRNWPALIGASLFVSVIYAGVAFYLLLTSEERAFAHQLLPILRRLPGQQGPETTADAG